MRCGLRTPPRCTLGRMSTFPPPPAVPRLTLTTLRDDARAMVEAGAVKIMRGVYLQPAPRLAPWEQLREATLARAAAALHTHPSAVCLTHEAAAIAHGYTCLTTEPDIHIAVPKVPTGGRHPLPTLTYTAEDGHTFRGRKVSLVRSTRLPRSEEVDVVDGLRVTNPLQTAVDCACDLPAREAICIVDSIFCKTCEADRFTRNCLGPTPEELRATLLAMLERYPRRPGLRRARAVLAIASPFSESPGESILRWAVHAAGLPEAVPQLCWQSREDSSTFFLDLGWEARKLGLEFDGYVKYGGSEDLRAEKSREMRLRRDGWRIERFEWSEIKKPHELAARLTSLFPADVVRNARPVRDLWL